MGVKSLLKALEGLTPTFLTNTLIEILNDNRFLVEEMNKKQLLSGTQSSGIDMPEYSGFTYDIKKSQGFNFRGHDRYQIFDTGELQAELYLDLNNNKITLWSRDPKAKFIESELSVEIFGLTPDNLVILVSEILRPELIKRVYDFIRKSI